MNQNGCILTLGAAVVDIPLCPVDKNTFEKDVCMLDDISMTVGGDALNEATVLARLGYRTRLVTMVGSDPAGDFILRHCKETGIDAGYLKVRGDVSTSINIPLIMPDGQRVFVTNRNGSTWKFCLEDIDFRAFDGVRVLSLDSIFVNPKLDVSALKTIFTEAKKRGVLICADLIKCRFGETLKDVESALQYVDYLFSNPEEAQALTQEREIGRMAEAFLKAGVGHVIIKDGSRGAYIAAGAERYLEPAYGKANCVDTTGAGDNFASGFIAALLEGKSLSECGKFANAVASIAIEKVGAVTAVRTREQVEQRYRDYLNAYPAVLKQA